jgi:hypothetical protein
MEVICVCVVLPSTSSGYRVAIHRHQIRIFRRESFSDLIHFHRQNKLHTTKSFPTHVESSNINHRHIFYTDDTCVLLALSSNQCTPKLLEMRSPTLLLLVIALVMQMQQHHTEILAAS